MTVLRWIAVLPVAVVAASVASFLLPPEGLWQFLDGSLSGAIYIGVFVWLGARIAPSRAKSTGIALVAASLAMFAVTGGWVEADGSSSAMFVRSSGAARIGAWLAALTAGYFALRRAWRGELGRRSARGGGRWTGIDGRATHHDMFDGGGDGGM